MLLAIDVGNTTTSIGLFAGRELREHFRLSTLRERTPDEWGMGIVGLVTGRGLEPGEIGGVMICSVVPPLNARLIEGIEKHLGRVPRFLDYRSSPIELAVEEPREVGPDRIANSIAIQHLYGLPSLVIDFGTATTFDLVSPEGNFLGGAISPEMELTAEMLVYRAALLPKVELYPPKSVIGRNTADNLRAGFVLGFIELIGGLIHRFQAESSPELKVIATGGKGELFYREIEAITEYDPYLTLRGLQIAWELRR